MNQVMHVPDPDGGPSQNFVYDYGLGEWQPVSFEEAQAAERGFAENAARSFGAHAVDAVGATLDALQAPFARSGRIMDAAGSGDPSQLGQPLDTVGRRVMASNDAAQAARWSMAPGSEIAGFVGALALPGGPAAQGTRQVRQAGRVMSPPASRIVSSAEEVVARNQVKTAARPGLGRLDDLGGAPGGSGSAMLAAGSELRRRATGMFFPDTAPKPASVAMADDLGIPLTEGMRRGSKSQQAMEEGMVRNPGALEVFEREIVQPTEERVTEIVRDAIGLDEGTSISRADFTMASDAISAEFDDIAGSIPGRYLVTEDDVSQLKDTVNAATRDNRVRRRVRQSWIDEFEGERAEAMADRPFSEARLDAKDIWGMIRELNEAIGTEKSTSTRDALTAVRDFWESRLFGDPEQKVLGLAGQAGPEIRDRIKNVNEKFRVQKLLEGMGVMRGEELNVKVLANAGQRQFGPQMNRTDYIDGRGRDLELPTKRLVQAMQVIRDFPATVGNSGTPTGVAMMGGPAKAMSSIAKTKAGAELYFGNPFKATGATLRPIAQSVGIGGP